MTLQLMTTLPALVGIDGKDSFENPVIGYGLLTVVAAMSVVFLAGAVLCGGGWSIDLDSKAGKISIRRFGEGR